MKKNKKQPKEIYLQRKKCDCIAQKHDLINNCLSCGKVVCAQEGEGPCLYCGEIVTRPDGRFITNDEALFPSLNKEELNKISKQRSQAVIHKDTLIERDKSTNLVQNIFDESIDYYDVSENQWLDEDSRQNAIDKLLEKEKFVEKEKFKSKVYFDPLTGQFVTEEFAFDEDSFRNEGKEYMRKKEAEEYQQKLNKNKNSRNMDDRMMKNEKVQELMLGLRTEKKEKERDSHEVLAAIEKKKKITAIVLEEQTQ